MTDRNDDGQAENGVGGFVAVNYIDCDEGYIERFEQLFGSRAHAIDRLQGFRFMHVLKPSQPGESYLIVSHWDHQDNFEAWTHSPEYIEGHKRGFEDIRQAKKAGQEPPMKSTFKTYSILTD